ncbi:MAG: carboxypeptidase-like regulatory domain-containing protein [Terracidiphilus sp.]|nr:carboxypeptidase-like regulatory domain-containing protein [Terracidiphilus sp.]
MAEPEYTIAGIVHDGSGARISHAHVAARFEGSATVVEAESGDQGEFRMKVPAPGSYRVEVTMEGFKPLAAEAVLTAEAPAAQLDLPLEIAVVTATVEVTADALAAETTSTQLGEMLDTKKIESVPLNGRSFTDLMAVQPGIVPVSSAQPGAVIMTGVASTPPSGDANPGNLSISGQREASNGFRVNGSDAEEDVNMGTSIVPNLDAIDSFRVLTSNFDAEYGNSSGGQVLVTTKSGATQVHGSAFEYLRNTALDARNYFSRDRAAFRQNQFGGTLGGEPFHKGVMLFGDYQGTRLTEGVDTGNISVPSLAERGGDFSQDPLTGSVNGANWAALLSSRLGRTVTAGEPYSQVFPTGQIPQAYWSAPAKYLLASIPRPNAGTALFATAAEAETLSDNKGALRLDWTHGKGTLTGYYFLDNYSLLNPYPTGTGGASVPGFSATSQGRAQLASLGHTITFGNAALNEFHLSYMRNANSVGQPKGGVGPSLAAQGFSTGSSGIVALKPSTEGIENVAFNDFTLGVDTTAIVQAENIYEVSDTFSRILGKHGLKAGGEIHANQINTHPDVIFNGSFAFSGSETGLDFADFLLGVPSSYTQGQASSFYNRNLYMAAFAQDSWKLTSQLTVNYGMRWDRIRPWEEKFNQLQTLVKGQQSQVFPGAPQGLVFPGDPGVPRSLAPARNNFAPRVGLAYAPAFTAPGLRRLTGSVGETSIRLGYGMFYTAYEGLSAGIMSANPPYGYTYTSAAPPLFDSPFTVAATGVSAGQRFPLQKVAYGASRANPNSSVDWSQFEPLVGVPAVDPADVTPYAEHWMASVERQFGSSTLVTLSYVGTASHHLLVLEEANPADPTLCLSLGSACGPFNEQAARTQFGTAFGSVELQRTIANASYNALEASLNHRSHGLDLLASYTYSKSIDESSGLPEPVNPVNPTLSRALSAFDLRHNLVTSFHYELPNLKQAGLFNWIGTGWAVSGIARFTSGLPVTLLNNNDTSLLGTIPNGINNNGVDTPNWSGKSLSLRTNPRGGAAVFDATQLTLPALGTMGNTRRRFFSGPGLENLDATISRRVLLKDNHSLVFRAEAFNLANHAQFFGAAAVEGNISSGSFGQAVSAMPPRLMQLVLRYGF